MQNNKIDSVSYEFDKPFEAVTNKLESWLDILVEMIPNMLLSVILLILFIVLSGLGQEIIHKSF